MSTDRAWILAELKKALFALSLPGREALATLPEGTVKADELALDYDHFLQVALDNFATEFHDAPAGGVGERERSARQDEWIA